MEQKLKYNDKGRSGNIVYCNGKEEINFTYEFGWAESVAIIDIPTIINWEEETKTKLSSRCLILKFVAEQLIADLAQGCKYGILDNYIYFVKNSN